MPREEALAGLSELAVSGDDDKLVAWLRVSPQFEVMVRVFSRICSATAPHESPEDVISEFLADQLRPIVSTWRSRPREKPFAPYFWVCFLRFAQKKCKERRKQHQIMAAPIDLEQYAFEGLANLPAPDAETTLAEQKTIVEDCLRRINHQHALVLRLHFAGYSPQEIAIRIQQKAASVRTWLRRGKQSFAAQVYLRLLQFTATQVRDFRGVCEALLAGALDSAEPDRAWAWQRLSPSGQTVVQEVAAGAALDLRRRVVIVSSLNQLLIEQGAQPTNLRIVADESLPVLNDTSVSAHSIPLNRVMLEDLLAPHILSVDWVRRGLVKRIALP